MSDSPYSFILNARQKIRYNAGEYDEKTHLPRYEIHLHAAPHVTHQVFEEQVLMGAEGHRLWVWILENKSEWPVFVTVKKDGVLVKRNY